MRLPMRIVSVCTAAALLAQSLLVLAVAPSPAYAVTIGEAQAVAGRVAAGTFHSLALTSGNTLFAWGDNAEGQTGLSGMTDVTKVAAGADHSLALKSDGTVVASGLDSYGQCQVPPGLIGVIAVAAGEEHSLALRSNGTVVAWGANTYGQSAVPAGLSGVVAIAAGGYHSLALKSNGTVVAWGANGRGQSAVPSTLTNVVGIAAGGFHSIALRSNGTVTGWGLNGDAQVTPPTGLTGVIAVAAGWRHTLALKSDGTVAAWGGGGVESSIAVPSGLTDAVAISAGWRHSIALRSNGTSVAWGLNESNQCLGPVSIDPVPNSKGIPTGSAFRIIYSAPVKAGSAYSQIRVEDESGSPVPVSSTLDGTQLTIVPSTALRTDERYIVRVPAGALVDYYGTSIISGTYQYATADTIPPAVLSVQPIADADGVSVNGLMSLEVSEPVALGSEIDDVALTSASGSTVECRYSTLLNRLVITPLVSLEPKTSYTLTIPAAAVTDLAGNPLAAQFTSSFTTGAAYTLTAKAGAGGSISPSGAVTVDHGANQLFTVTPNVGYDLGKVLVDGEPVQLAEATYAFESVSRDHTIEASFVPRTYTITATAGAGGSITPSGAITVGHGETLSFTVTAGESHRVASVLVDSTPVSLSSGTYTLTNVTANHTITAMFAFVPAVTSLSASAPGTITYGGTATIQGSLLDTQGRAVPDRIVTLQRSYDRSSWSTVTSMRTLTTGTYSWAQKPTRNTYYRVQFAGDGGHVASISAERLVKTKVRFSDSPRMRTYTHTRGTSHSTWGYFKPRRAANTGATVRVLAYRYERTSSGTMKWVYKRSYRAKVTNPRGSSWSRYSATVKLPSKGSWRLAVRYYEDSLSARTTSGYRRVKVR